MKPVKIRQTILGQGRPKIAVPLTAKTTSDLLVQAKEAKALAEVTEWRIDFFESVLDFASLTTAAQQLREVIGEIPLLITFRTAKEGGAMEISEDKYFEIYEHVVTNKLADILDIELFQTTRKVKKMAILADANDIKVIMSNHDFTKTPTVDEMIRRLELMASYHADILKIAVMPNSVLDVLNLLTATQEVAARLDQPVISMAMGDLGKLTRICGEVVGSCLTFGSVGQASAPGQIEAQSLKEILQALKVN